MSTRSIFIDCGSGVAGDMLLGALADLGLAPAELNRTLQKIVPFKGWKIVISSVERGGWPARLVTVQGDRTFGSAGEMRRAIQKSALVAPAKSAALRVLDRLTDAEKKAHGSRYASFEPKGLGLLDTVVDVVGVCWGLWRLGLLTQITASAINTGRVAPATARMLRERKIPVYSTQSRFELATPTGVAILSTLASSFGDMPPAVFERTGYGAGHQELEGRPNILGIHCLASQRTAWPQDRVVVLETVIDDMDPRLYPHVAELLHKAGALDVWWTPIGMKKGRPGIALTVLSTPELEQACLKILFWETTTLGIRRMPMTRWTLARKSKGLSKIAILPGGEIKRGIEFEKAKHRAVTFSRPLRAVLY